MGTGLFQYFIKVIPTHYKGQDGTWSAPGLLWTAWVSSFLYTELTPKPFPQNPL